MSLYTLDYESCYGTLTIGGVALAGPGWVILSLASLWESPEIRGTDVLLPGVTGVRRYRRRVMATKHSLPLAISGAHNRLGVEYGNPYVGAETNLRYLLNNVVLPTNVGDGTRTAVMTLPSGGTVTAPVHVERLSGVEHNAGGIIKCLLEISDPTGSLHP